MINKIVILDDSVTLYQHYIGDDKWETVMAFPRNGLTYTIQNNGIRFFAFEDYFYRNLIISMELPLYIVDKAVGIEGEFSDIELITNILDRIFVQSDGEADLSLYLKKVEAQETYQPIGDYVTIDEIDELLDDYYTKDETDDLLNEKLDASAYTPVDWSDYYTKQETDALLDEKLDASAYTPVDLSDYYTKDESDSRFQPIGNYLSGNALNGYATESWVQNQGYINHIKTINNISLIGEGNIQIGSGGTIDAYTKAEADEIFQPKGDYVLSATFITYITNLQNQIDSLQEALEACCSGQTGETLYRWITLTGSNDYICSGTTKYSKEQKQQSTDNGATWTNVSPAEYRTGSVIETQSSDCGYQPTIEYQWVTVSGGYVCSGTTKYSQEKKQYRVDGGSWIDTDPLQTRQGSTIIETDSTDCGYIAPQYRWYQASASDYLCSGTSKYYKEYYQISTDGGNTWNNVTPTQTRQGALIESQSTDCGYIAPQYRWYTAPNSDYICSGTTKYEKQYYQVSYDGGTTWENVTPTQTRTGNIIETESTDCGYVEGTKLLGLKNNNRLYAYDCGTSSAITSAETYSSATRPYSVDKIRIGSCVTNISGKSFSDCYVLSTVSGDTSNITTIGNSAFLRCHALSALSFPNVTSIDMTAFVECSALTSVTLSKLVTVNDDAFRDCDLRTLDLPRIAYIHGLAFYHNSNLASVTIGEHLTDLYGSAFKYCTALTSVTINTTTPPNIVNVSVENMATQGPFANTPIDGGNGYIYVPAASLEAYKTATKWSYYANNIRPIP